MIKKPIKRGFCVIVITRKIAPNLPPKRGGGGSNPLMDGETSVQWFAKLQIVSAFSNDKKLREEYIRYSKFIH